MYANAYSYSDDVSEQRFVAEMDSRNGYWLVFDTRDQNRVVGVHASATLAALDAMKREQDSR